MADRQSIGARIKAFRELSGMNQSELAKRSGVHRPTISLLERGIQNDITLSAARRLARALGVSLSMLVGDDTRAAVDDEEVPDLAAASH